MNSLTLFFVAVPFWIVGQNTDDTAKSIVASPIVLSVTAGADSRQVPVTVEGFPEAIAQKPIVWRPHDVQEPLVSISNPGLSVPLGRPPKQMAHVSFEFTRGHLSADRPQTLVLSVEDAESIPAGIYQGTLRSDMYSILVPDVAVSVHWPIVLVVPGRRLEGLTFPEAPLIVGSDSSVGLDIVTVGCPLGVGALEVSFSAANEKQDHSILHIPLPLSRVVDTGLDLNGEKNVLCKQAKCGKPWQMALVHTDVTEAVTAEISRHVPDEKVVRHHLQIDLPQCFDIGTMCANIAWERGAGRDEPINSECVAEVAAGIRVTPRLAIRNEELTVEVVTKKSLGNEISLLVTAGKEQRTLTLRSRQNATGSISYRTKFRPNRLDTYTISAPEKLRNELPCPVEVPVVLRAIDQLNSPIVVVRSAAPWWGFLKDAGGAGPVVRRRKAYSLNCPVSRSENVQVSLSGILVQAPSKEYIPLSPQVQPNVPRILLLGSDVKETSSAEEERESPASWAATASNEHTVTFDVVASICSPKGELMEQVITGQRWYRLRLHLAVTRDGQTVHRLVHVPLRVDVLTGPEYYATYAKWKPLAFLLLFGGLVLGLVFLWILWRYVISKPGHFEPRVERDEDGGFSEGRPAGLPDEFPVEGVGVFPTEGIDESPVAGLEPVPIDEGGLDGDHHESPEVTIERLDDDERSAVEPEAPIGSDVDFAAVWPDSIVAGDESSGLEPDGSENDDDLLDF